MWSYAMLPLLSTPQPCWDTAAQGTWTLRRSGLPRPPLSPRSTYLAAADPGYLRYVLTDGHAVDSFRHQHSVECFSVDPPPSCFPSVIRYDWNVHFGRILTHASRGAFCKTMHALDVLSVAFIGDSISYQMYQSLWTLLEMSTPLNPLVRNRASLVPCDGNRSISVSFVTGFQAPLEGSDVRNLAAKIAQSDLTVLNLNVAHYSEASMHSLNKTANTTRNTPNRAFFEDIYAVALAIKQHVRGDYKRLILWRTTPSGHDKCLERTGTNCTYSMMHKPKCSYVQPESQSAFDIGSNVDFGRGDFNWNEFRSRDQYVRELFINSMPANFRYLDVTRMSEQRADSHTAIKHMQGKLGPDCLHNVLPGLPDYWNALLLHSLQACEISGS